MILIFRTKNNQSLQHIPPPFQGYVVRIHVTHRVAVGYYPNAPVGAKKFEKY
jgi:hypothetical protein